MIILKDDATDDQIQNVIKEIEKCGLRTRYVCGEVEHVILLIGDETGEDVDFNHFGALPGVRKAEMVQDPYKLAKNGLVLKKR